MSKLSVVDSVKEYYGTVLQSSSDLQTNACCLGSQASASLQRILSEIHPEVIERFYGCGSPIPPLLEGCTVLDLGSGSGRDCFVLSKLVGPHGKVIGVDMTDEQLAVANRFVDHHTEKFGYLQANVEFRKGYLEDLQSIGIEDNSVDVIVSNCVINLSPDKSAVFSEIFRVLKPDGEMYFSDVFADRRIPEYLLEDPVLVGECLSGAMYLEDFRRELLANHCKDFRVVEQAAIETPRADIQRKLGAVKLCSMTIRFFKSSVFEDRCEDYGQVARYHGSIEDFEAGFALDSGHYFETGRQVAVCGNTALILSNKRYAPHFTITGDKSQHLGLFKGASGIAPSTEKTVSGCC